MKVVHETLTEAVICGDCLEVMKTLPDSCMDTIVTDPPYGLSFMGKKWDYDVPSVEIWKECLRVLKPGGTMLCFAGSRTQHRMAVNVEDAGFILKDCIMWLYGSGFPKATDISKQLDKGHERKVTGQRTDGRFKYGFSEDAKKAMGNEVYEHTQGFAGKMGEITEPATNAAKVWNGWKSHGLKPAYEPILVAMKPNDGTYANNALVHGVSGLNIDGGRIPTTDKIQTVTGGQARVQALVHSHGYRPYKDGLPAEKAGKDDTYYQNPQGRYPANIILDEEAGRMLDEQTGNRPGCSSPSTAKCESKFRPEQGECQGQGPIYPGKGGASRFFYCAKASKKERNAGCGGLEGKVIAWSNQAKAELARGNETWTADGTTAKHNKVQKLKNSHPTVKPLALMEYLCTLTKTPTGGVVLDPFAGSGTTLLAAKNTGRPFVGIEKDEDENGNSLGYCDIIKARLTGGTDV